ncbi:hypothetical protein COLO4_19429 [Corchorus olitorius]|uniref:Uncharacterized protein n=1 Tax=Corchorus olitorius TaxID=93759 RepID=A0A1R3J5D1_9ROSI|nr:hypothetical protein COLO4_19429 [Corchorus olitorius]
MTQKSFNPGDFSGCPLLESLKLTHIHFGEDKTLFINAPKLKRLELSFRWSDWGNEYDARKVVIDAPGLMSFQYCSSAPIVCSFADDLASIDHAYFDIYNCYLYGYCEGDEEDKEDDMHFDKYREYVLHCINTLIKFHQAKSVTLSWKTVGATM